MTLWLLIDLAVFLCVMLLTGIIIPQILLIAFRKNLFDTPNPRKIHTSAVPRLGGIAFFPSIMFAILLLYGFGTIWPDPEVRDLLYKNMRCVCFSGAGAILLYLIGSHYSQSCMQFLFDTGFMKTKKVRTYKIPDFMK